MNQPIDAIARYPELLRRVAEQALSGLADEPADDASVMLGYPCAAALVGAEAERDAWVDALPAVSPALRDALEQGTMLATPPPQRERRPVYLPWVLSLQFHAARDFQLDPEGNAPLVELAEALHDQLTGASTADYNPLERSAATLCEALAMALAAGWLDRPEWVEPAQWRVHAVLSRTGKDGALQPLAEGESLDAWTYRELVGIHALHRLAGLLSHRAWGVRVRDAVAFHLGHTQPDNATTQPWALAAFLESPGDASGIGFADQQLHDAMMQGGGSLHPVAAMLVADAACTLRTKNAAS